MSGSLQLAFDVVDLELERVRRRRDDRRDAVLAALQQRIAAACGRTRSAVNDVLLRR